MTDEEIDALVAGRETDKLIAEIMGWSHIIYAPVCFTYISGKWSSDGDWIGGVGGDIIPHYSTSIADAWEIVESFRHGWNGCVAACIFVDTYDSDVSGCDTECRIESPEIRVSAMADSAQLALCKAALKAYVEISEWRKQGAKDE